jgi:RNase P protein component
MEKGINVDMILASIPDVTSSPLRGLRFSPIRSRRERSLEGVVTCMELAFAAPNARFPTCARWRQPTLRFKCCCGSESPSPNSAGLVFGPETPPRVRTIKQSLPTARERRWLSEQRICLDRSRGARYSRQESFSLAVWHLGIARCEMRLSRRSRPWHGLDNNEFTSGVGTFRSEFLPEENACVVDTTLEDFSSTDDENNESLSASSIGTQNQCVGEEAVVHVLHNDLEMPQPNPFSIGAMGRPDPDGTSYRGPTLDQFLGIMTWAYIVRVRATKFTMGKRAVIRNRAQRRVRAALRTVCPTHASRGLEYVVTTSPASLLTPFPDLLEEVKAALQSTNCWRDDLSEKETIRPRYNKR